MPPQTRTRSAKNLKENIELVKKTKPSRNERLQKKARQPLADKTNSLSDDNASIDEPIKTIKKATKSNVLQTKNKEENVRSRRERRLPTRYVENDVLLMLSNSKDAATNSVEISSKLALKNTSIEVVSKNSVKTITQVKERPKRQCRIQSEKEKPINVDPPTPNKTNKTISPFKTPTTNLDSSLIANRPKRICRLPSKFEDHSISPHKFIPVQPYHASTPIAQKIAITSKPTKPTQESQEKSTKTSKILKQTTITSYKKKDTNNAKTETNQKSVTAVKSPPKSTKILAKKVNTVANKKSPTKRIINANFSFRILEDKPKPSTTNQDIYEFTYDPNEEPPQKKKRKRVVKKKPTKPKTFVLKHNYDQNVSKALETLKSKVKPGTSQSTQPTAQKVDAVIQKPDTTVKKVETAPKVSVAAEPQNAHVTVPEIHITSASPPNNETAKTSIHESNYASIRVEDIAADFELTTDNHNDLNYSPITTPCRPQTPENPSEVPTYSHISQSIANRDPLNLQENLSFFEEQPVASSSMNVSSRHPTANPWRVEFSNLPIRWHTNTYLKPNMTPALESSVIATEDDFSTKKKCVYTNLVPEADEPLPEIVENNTPNLVQTSIISFIKEVAERSAKKRERSRSTTPRKTNSLFEDVPTSTEFGYKTPKKARKDKIVVTPVSNDNESTKDTSKESIETDKQEKQKQDKDCTYFGFDESDNQENVAPTKVPDERVRALRPRARAVLQEINSQGPTRSILPVAKKLASSEVVDKMYEQLKSAEDAPQFPEKHAMNEIVSTNIDDEINEDESVHLFEDIEVVHHLKPQRKSYGKAKKVTFRQNSLSDDSDDTQQEQPRVSDDDDGFDDLADLNYMPNVNNKKKNKKKTKKKTTYKETKEVEEWAAGFNSMCEDIEEFPLVVE